MKLMKSAALKLVRTGASRLGFDLVPRENRQFGDGISEIVDRVAPYTMTSPERIAALCDAVDYAVARGLEGDIVECGVWKGGSSIRRSSRCFSSSIEKSEPGPSTSPSGFLPPCNTSAFAV